MFSYIGLGFAIPMYENIICFYGFPEDRWSHPSVSWLVFHRRCLDWAWIGNPNGKFHNTFPTMPLGLGLDSPFQCKKTSYVFTDAQRAAYLTLRFRGRRTLPFISGRRMNSQSDQTGKYFLLPLRKLDFTMCT